MSGYLFFRIYSIAIFIVCAVETPLVLFFRASQILTIVRQKGGEKFFGKSFSKLLTYGEKVVSFETYFLCR